MSKKNLSVTAVAVVAVIGLLTFCNNDNPASSASSQTTGINGTWTGLTAIRSLGAGQPDTFSCVLKIDSAAGEYSMQRGHVLYGSSGSVTDSTKETGTLTQIGTDSLMLTPSGTACYYYDPGVADWLHCDGTLSAQFRTCPDPIHIKNDISGTTWSVTMPRYDDTSHVTYSLKKQ